MQTNLAQQIKASLHNGEASASWIIVGPRGVGKHQFVLDFTKDLTGNTAEYNPNVKWLECDFTETAKKEIQKTILAGQAIDNPEEIARKTEITVNDVRAGCQFLSMTSNVVKVLVIELADEMNENAQNALLKTLEEPYKNTLILLLCENMGKLLPTIRSRCQIGRLTEISEKDMLIQLKKTHSNIDAATLKEIVDLSCGSVGIAEDLIANKGVEMYHKILQLARPAKSLSITAIASFIDETLGMEKGFELAKYLILFYVHELTKNNAQQSLDIGYDLAELYQSLNTLWQDQQNLNLDKRQTLLNAFYRIGGVLS